MLCLPLPCRVEDDSTNDANEHQADATEYQVRPCPKPDQTRAEGLVAGRCQELQGAVCEGPHIEGRRLLCVFPGCCICGDVIYDIVERLVGGRVGRNRSRCNGVAHGGCVSACMGARNYSRLSAACEAFWQRVRRTIVSRGRRRWRLIRLPHSWGDGRFTPVQRSAALPHSDW